MNTSHSEFIPSPQRKLRPKFFPLFVALLALFLPFLARIPGHFFYGSDWSNQYYSQFGFIFLFNLIFAIPAVTISILCELKVALIYLLPSFIFVFLIISTGDPESDVQTCFTVIAISLFSYYVYLFIFLIRTFISLFKKINSNIKRRKQLAE